METEALVGAPSDGNGATKKSCWTLRWLNLALAAFQFITGVAMCVLADPDKAAPLYTHFAHVGAERTVASQWPEARHVGKVSIGLLSGIFILLSFADHFLVATFLYKPYKAALKEGRNPFRWIEYSVSAPLMHVEIALLCGIYDVHTLFAIFGLTSITMVFGYLGETAPKDGSSESLGKAICHGRTPTRIKVFLLGCIPHLYNWFIIFCYFFRAVHYGNPPDFVWSIIFIIFAVDASFGIVALGHARGVRVSIPCCCCRLKIDLSEYRNVELCYMALSILAKQSLAWMQYWGIEGMRKD
jgi:hypothetical protein